MRLLYFDITQGNKIALQYLADELGWPATLKLAARLKYQLWFHNPFKEINRNKKRSANERLSQRQMATLVVLYRLLEQEYAHERTMRNYLN